MRKEGLLKADSPRDVDLTSEQLRPAVIADLLAVADREMKDARSVRSEDGRLDHACAARLAHAGNALLPCRYGARHAARALVAARLIMPSTCSALLALLGDVVVQAWES
jgi:hypothetical protein